MPPAAIRRPLTISTWLVLCTVILVLSPVLILVGAIAARLLRKPQPLLLARILIAYCARELAVLIACGLLWLCSGCGVWMHTAPLQGLHQRLLRWFVHSLSCRGLDLLDLNVDPAPSPDALAALRSDRPLLYFSRHAGPGDTVFLIDLLFTRYSRLPSVVFKETLAIDPCVDLIGHRLPHAVLDVSDPQECKRQITETSAQLPPRGVLLLFPEGANYTPARRRAALSKLWRKGHRREAAIGERMEHVLPPHPTGALAALDASPDADVIFSAHTGLGLAAFPKQLWANTPYGRTLRTQMWLVPSAERPGTADEQVKWLYAWWQRLDEWVDSQGQEG